MRISIHQPQYLPWLGYFDKIARSDVFVLLDNVQFKKNEWQNRNRIRTSQGWQWLTVPVLHDHGQMIQDVRINPAVDWRGQHRKALEFNYARAPYFPKLWPLFAPVYEQEWADLASLNIRLIGIIHGILGLRTRLVMASSLPVTTVRTERLVDICRHLGADTYLAGAGCVDYMDTAAFANVGLKYEVQEYQHPSYPQLWGGEFISHLSIVDLLFNVGPSALRALSSDAQQ